MKQKSFLIVLFSGIVIVAGAIAGVFFWLEKSHNPVPAEITATDRVPAPGFTFTNIDGENITLDSFLGKKNLVLFFSGGLDCFPCLQQIIELNKDARLNNEETQTLSVILDPPQSWQQAKKELPFLSDAEVVFDDGGKVFQSYALLDLSSLMQEGAHASHTYFVIDKKGIIRHAIDDPYMGIRNELLLDVLKKI